MAVMRALNMTLSTAMSSEVENSGQLPGAAETGLLQGRTPKKTPIMSAARKARVVSNRAAAEKGLNHATAPGKTRPPHSRRRTGSP